MKTIKSNFFDSIAWFFNTFMWLVRNPKKYAKAILSAADLKNLGGKDKKILDIGGGTGSIAKYLIPYSKQIIVLDPAKEMLARIKNAEIKKVRGIVQDAKLKKGYFDLIYCADSFHHFTNGYAKKDYKKSVSKAVRKMLFALKKNGSLIIIEFDTSRFLGRTIGFLENRLLKLGSSFYNPKSFSELWRRHNVYIKIKRLDNWCYLAKITKKPAGN